MNLINEGGYRGRSPIQCYISLNKKSDNNKKIKSDYKVDEWYKLDPNIKEIYHYMSKLDGYKDSDSLYYD